VFALIGARKWGKKYKQPVVLVSRPAIRESRSSPINHLNITPLRDCEDPPNVGKQLNAMQDSFNALWRVYLFVHPIFHTKDRYAEAALQKVEELFLAFLEDCTHFAWKNAISRENLLPNEPLDIRAFVYDADREEERPNDMKVENEATQPEEVLTFEETVLGGLLRAVASTFDGTLYELKNLDPMTGKAKWLAVNSSTWREQASICLRPWLEARGHRPLASDDMKHFASIIRDRYRLLAERDMDIPNTREQVSGSAATGGATSHELERLLIGSIEEFAKKESLF
jgi:hypothetical protein